MQTAIRRRGAWAIAASIAGPPGRPRRGPAAASHPALAARPEPRIRERDHSRRPDATRTQGRSLGSPNGSALASPGPGPGRTPAPRGAFAVGSRSATRSSRPSRVERARPRTRPTPGPAAPDLRAALQHGVIGCANAGAGLSRTEREHCDERLGQGVASAPFLPAAIGPRIRTYYDAVALAKKPDPQPVPLRAQGSLGVFDIDCGEPAATSLPSAARYTSGRG